MITAALILILVTIAQAIGLIFPTLPATPDAIVDMGNAAVAFVQGSLGFATMLFTPVLFAAVITVTILRMNLIYILAGFRFVIRKIPVLSQHIKF